MAHITPTQSATSGQVLIASQVLGSAASTITFSAIPQIYNHLELIILARSTSAAVEDSIGIKLNSDGGANYDRQFLQASVASTSSGASTGLTQIGAAGVTSIAGGTATAGAAGIVRLWIPGYRQTSFNKTLFISGGVADTSIMRITSAVGTWLNTAAITQIDLTAVSGSTLAAGSAAYLYGAT